MVASQCDKDMSSGHLVLYQHGSSCKALIESTGCTCPSVDGGASECGVDAVVRRYVKSHAKKKDVLSGFGALLMYSTAAGMQFSVWLGLEKS